MDQTVPELEPKIRLQLHNRAFNRLIPFIYFFQCAPLFKRKERYFIFQTLRNDSRIAVGFHRGGTATPRHPHPTKVVTGNNPQTNALI